MLLECLSLPLLVILSQIAVLAEAIGVVGPVDVLAFVRHFRFAFPVIAVVAHVLRVLLLVNVWAIELLVWL